MQDEIPVKGNTPREENANLALWLGGTNRKIASITRKKAANGDGEVWVITYG